MSVSTSELWQTQDDRSSEGSGAWIGVLLFMGSAAISVKTLTWFATFAAGIVMQ